MKVNEKFWHRVAVIAGIFTLLVSILLIANYFQLSKADPVNQKIINSLVERLSQNPSDMALREQIRELDLLSRKAYFTNQWQIKIGGYLVLAGLSLLIIALQIAGFGKKNQAVFVKESDDFLIMQLKYSRRWIAVSIGMLIVFAFITAFLSNKKLDQMFGIDSQIPLAKFLPASDSLIVNATDTIKNSIDSIAITSTTIVDSSTSTLKTDDSNNDNYPGFRGVGGNGISNQKNVPTAWDGASGKNMRWKTAIPLPGFNSPVLWGIKLFVTGASATNREVYCIDKITGKFIWTYKVERVNGSPVESPKVNSETGFAAPTVASDGKGVYAIFANGDIVALSLEGKLVWSKNLGVPQNHYGYSSSLLVFNDRIYVQYDQRTGGKLMAISCKTGAIVWSVDRDVKTSWSSPILATYNGISSIVVAAEPFVAAYNPNNGNLLWKIDCISGEVGPSPTYSNGMIYSVNDYSNFSAIKLGSTPQVLWESDEFLSDVPSPVANNKYVFLVTSYGVVVCYDVFTGKKYWEHELNESVYASPIIAESKLFVVDKNGVTHIFKVDIEMILITSSSLGEKTFCTPAFSNSCIYLRGDNNLYCFGK